ncbi:MAG: putative DCC family thiol-disulfide oxidoreductase YuxK [Paracoccaceae bacterium]|jgi:predicted DCC family thiol-disulfide oxidoreductase YuxK
MEQKLEVIYNAQCPVCRFEIDSYRKYATNKALPLGFRDLSTGDLAAYGLTQDQAARRLHVVTPDGVLSGIAAFIALWQEMPRYRWLALIVGLPGVRHVSIGVYDYVLAPALYAMHRRRAARHG